ncbi:MAG: flagellar basal body-associated FliL family protein [Lachnospiraceae bacterium]|nr:flagellar basal body-associated FliL family protein [Lachnospiraceae bacterium]
MKKGLLNLILLVLVITNVALTAILVFAIVPAMNATSQLVNKVAAAIDLEKELKDSQSDTLSIDETQTFTFADSMTIYLKPDKNGNKGYAKFQITLVLDKTHEDFNKYEPNLATYESQMRTVVNQVLDDYTADEFSANKDQIAVSVRNALRDMFDESEFIYSVGFSDLIIQ